MLSDKAENFLIKLKAELLLRGKNETEIEEIIDELHDHLAIAEANNEDVSSIVNTPIKAYADNFSEELSRDTGLGKFIYYLATFLILIFIIPRMIDNSFTLSLSLILYITFGYLLVFIFDLIVLKKAIVRWGDNKKTYIVVGIWSVTAFLLFIGLEWLTRHYPLVTFWNPSFITNIIMGSILLVISVIITIIKKQKFFGLILIGLCLPEIIGLLVTGKDYTNTNFLIISLIGLIIFNCAFIGYTIYAYYKDKRSKN